MTEQENQEQKSSGFSIFRFIPWPILIFIVVIFVIIGNMSASVFSILNPPPTVEIMSSETLALGIKPLGELSTVSRQYATARIDVNLIYGPVCRIYTRHTTQATIKAGFDINRITVDDIKFDEETDTYTIKLPPHRILDCIFDPFATEEYLRVGQTVVCQADSNEMRMLATYEALNAFIKKANDDEILIDAQNQSEILVGNFVESLTDKKVIIEFSENDITDLPPSCIPSVNGDWLHNNQTNEWIKR